jgi:putative membrane protein
MDARRYRTFQALILALTGFFLLEKVWSGKILLYINQRFVLLILIAGVILIASAQMIFQERNNSELAGEENRERNLPAASPGSRANLIWMVIPLVLGMLIPPRALSTSALPNRGITVSSPFTIQNTTSTQALERPAGQRTVLDWIRAFHAESNPQSLNAEPADVIGFVYHDPRLKNDQFLVGRYTIACCIADATAIGIMVNWPQSAALENNNWVRVQGTISAGELDGQSVPEIDADKVIPIQEPDQPYLFP